MTLANINWPYIIAGLGLFLFGIQYMGEGLKKYSGDKLKNIIDKYTSNQFKSIIIGAFVTCLIQSSSGTTALTIGLIRSGLMSFKQSIGIIMGANIGTIITSVFVGSRLSQYSVYFIIFGAIFLLFSKSKKPAYLGQVVFGFGCLFYGLELMGNNLANISEISEFSQITSYLVKNPLLGLLGGIILTAIVQSSAAIIAIIQQMYAIKAINLTIALPFLFGSNIGTTITAVIASIGGNISAKRASFFHVEYIANMKTIKDLERIGDLCINMTNYYEAIYDEKEDFSLEARIDLETMMNLVIDMLEHSIKSFENHEFDDIKYINDKESDLDYFNKKAKQRHIMRVTNKIEKSALVNSTYVDILANIERIGDHCQNIAQSYLLDEGF